MGECPVLIAETLVVREAMRAVICMNIDNIIMESYSQVAIDSIMGRIIAPK